MTDPGLMSVLTDETFVGTSRQPPLIAVLAAVVLAAGHVFGGRLAFGDRQPRSRFLSAAGGISVSYVFLHLLPAVPTAGRTIARGMPVVAYAESRAYLVALAGFVIFYGLEWYVSDVDDSSGGSPPPGTFWIHIAPFAVYNGIIGYLIVYKGVFGILSLVLYVVAMGLHLLVNDVGLRNHHRVRYRRVGRWVLASAVVGGVGIGIVTTVREVAVAILFAFVGGGMILNVIKEDLPEERESRFPAFAAGAIGYSLLLLAV